MLARDTVALAFVADRHDSRPPKIVTLDAASRRTYEERYANLQRALQPGAAWFTQRPSPAAIQLALLNTINDNTMSFDLRDRAAFDPSARALSDASRQLGEEAISNDAGKNTMAKLRPNFYAIFEAVVVLGLNGLKKGVPMTHYGCTLLYERIANLKQRTSELNSALETVILTRPSGSVLTADAIARVKRDLQKLVVECRVLAKKLVAAHVTLRTSDIPIKSEPPSSARRSVSGSSDRPAQSTSTSDDDEAAPPPEAEPTEGGDAGS